MAAPVFVASYAPTGNWTTATTPKTQTVTAAPGDVLVVLGGTEDSSTALGTPSGGSLTYTLSDSQSVASSCALGVWTTAPGGSPPVLTITTTSLPDATAGSAYSQTLTATGGTGTGYTWSVSAGSLPAWASLGASTGVISGTPSSGQTGTASFTVLVTDSGGNTDPQALSVTVNAVSGVQPLGPSGSWTLAWSDEFNDGTGMSGHTHGLALAKWNCGWFFGPSAIGGTGYNGTSFTDSSGGGAIEFYGPGALNFPSGGGMNMSCYAPGAGPDGASYSAGGHSSTSESGGVNTAGLMHFTPNTGYTVPSNLASTTIQAASIVIEIKCKVPGPNAAAGNYWAYMGTYNCGDSSVPGMPGAGTWAEEMDFWEELGGGTHGSSFFVHFHAGSTYNGPSSVPSSLSSTDLSLAYHTYTVKVTYSTITFWVDGVQTGGISPSAAVCQSQWSTPQYLNILFQLFGGYTPTGSSGATPWGVSYVRVFTQ